MSAVAWPMSSESVRSELHAGSCTAMRKGAEEAEEPAYIRHTYVRSSEKSDLPTQQYYKVLHQRIIRVMRTRRSLPSLPFCAARTRGRRGAVLPCLGL